MDLDEIIIAVLAPANKKLPDWNPPSLNEWLLYTGLGLRLLNYFRTSLETLKPLIFIFKCQTEC